jgi:hypothetical protein
MEAGANGPEPGSNTCKEDGPGTFKAPSYEVALDMIACGDIKADEFGNVVQTFNNAAQQASEAAQQFSNVVQQTSEPDPGPNPAAKDGHPPYVHPAKCWRCKEWGICRTNEGAEALVCRKCDEAWQQACIDKAVANGTLQKTMIPGLYTMPKPFALMVEEAKAAQARETEPEESEEDARWNEI